MSEKDRLILEMLVADFVSLCIGIPVGIYKTKRYIKEGKSIKNLPRKVLLTIVLPIICIPFLLSNLYWPWKILMIVGGALVGVSNLIGIDAAQTGLRQMLGLPPIDEDTGQVVKDKDDKEKDKNEK